MMSQKPNPSQTKQTHETTKCIANKRLHHSVGICTNKLNKGIGRSHKEAQSERPTTKQSEECV